jgi:5'-deoxynucleotidase YfbR-like HD superfamily hydrolase
MARIFTTTGTLNFDTPQTILQHKFCIDDIAESLAFINRWNGYAGSYSVGQHSLNCLSALEAYKPDALGIERLHVMMHDAEEAYTGDIIRPVKASLENSFEDRRKAIVAGIRRDLYPPCLGPSLLQYLDAIAYTIDEAVNHLEAQHFFPTRDALYLVDYKGSNVRKAIAAAEGKVAFLPVSPVGIKRLFKLYYEKFISTYYERRRYEQMVEWRNHIV